jgi:ParB/RepB/Spo0J family partition protein
VTVIDHPTRISPPDPSDPDRGPEPTDPAPAGPVQPVVEPAAVVPLSRRVLLELDPRLLPVSPLNPRSDVGDLSELTASIAESGVLQPLTVVPDADAPLGFMVLWGMRRRAAAIEAGLAVVPCDPRPEYAGKTAEQLADMLAENLHRQALSGAEEADGYAQLSAFEGWTPERIAKRVGRPVERVRTALAAASASEALRPGLLEGQVTLEQAAAIEEFAGDPKAYERLITVVRQNPVGLHWALADERQKHQLATAKAITRRGLVDSGVRTITRPQDFPWSSVAARVRELTGPDGELLTAKSHASCPGHAAFVDKDGQPEFVCQNPKDWGHGVPPSYRHRGQDEVRAAEEAAAARRELEQAMAVAAEARLGFLAEYVAAKGRPKAGTLRLALRVLAVKEHIDVGVRAVAGQLVNPQASPERAVTEFVEAVERSGETRLPLLALAYAAGVGEVNLRGWRDRFRFDPAAAAQWLTVLEQLGYPLSEVEAQQRTTWAEQVARDAQADQYAETDDEMDEDQDDPVEDSAEDQDTQVA